MDGRQARGRVLAQAQGDRIRHIEGDVWYVPSSQGTGGYLVSGGRCGCPDESEKCKHVVAVEIVRGASVRTEESAPVVTLAPPKAPTPPQTMPRGDLTAEEQEYVRAALRFLRTRAGSAPALGKAIRMHGGTLDNVIGGWTATAGLAVRLARYAGVPVDDVITGRFPPPGACAHCGHVPPAVAVP